MDPITIAVLILGALAVIAIIAFIAHHTGSTTAQPDMITFMVGGANCSFTHDQWQQIRGHLTNDGITAVRRLDTARDNLRIAERSGNATQVAETEHQFNTCVDAANTAYQQAALAWFKTPPGQHWLALQRLPNKTL